MDVKKKFILRIDKQLSDIFLKYIEDLREDIKKVKKHLAENDLESIIDLGHRFRGSGGIFGLNKVSEIGGKIEASAREKKRKDIEKQIAELSDFTDSIEVVYKDT